MDSARASALAVVRRGLREQAELLIALQWLGMLAPDALRELREEDAIVARIMSVPVQPEPATRKRPVRAPQERAAMRQAGRVAMARTRSPRVAGTDRTQFARWVEGEVEWSPAIMGWSADDPRAEGYEDGRYDR